MMKSLFAVFLLAQFNPPMLNFPLYYLLPLAPLFAALLGVSMVRMFREMRRK